LVLLTDGNTPANVSKRIKVGDNSTLLTKPGVHLLSGHVGKGQQFDWGVVVGVEEDVVPFFEARTPEAIQEEARVLSVMMSRARHGVVLSFSASVPTLAGRPRGYSPSQFLTPELRATLTDDAALVSWFSAADWAAVAAR
jgi:DNA helicase-2/ATP-dependent DNA helicase PcrA